MGGIVRDNEGKRSIKPTKSLSASKIRSLLPLSDTSILFSPTLRTPGKENMTLCNYLLIGYVYYKPELKMSDIIPYLESIRATGQEHPSSQGANCSSSYNDTSCYPFYIERRQ